ncbi:MAG: SRPBCC domain-containing protein, partial [Betaproteobacteria bacterium]|nr:SRPBCC domain-containing protein [Betaproteobacteria bacterium]
AKFKGKLKLSDIVPPSSYSLAFEGQGGVAGFGKGGAQVSLAAEGAGTRLSYSVKASVGGKIAQIGSRLGDMAAKKLAEDFFQAFNEKVASLQGGPAHETAHGEVHDEHHPEPLGRDPSLPDVSSSSLAWFAGGALVVFVVALFALFG